MQLQKKSILLLLHVLVATCSQEPSSPLRSRFEYEERLLERVLQIELALGTTLNEILKTNAKVVDALKQDEKTRVDSTLDSMNSTLAANIGALVKKQNEMEKRLSDFINNASNNINSTLANSLKILKDQLKVPSIFFLARISSTTEISINQDVVFPTVMVNEGQGYHPSTGKFTASVSGMYLFSVQYCAYQKRSSALEIVHRGMTIQRSNYHGNTDDWPCMTMQVLASVAMGDQVWVRTTTSSRFDDDSRGYTSFSGTLIHV